MTSSIGARVRVRANIEGVPVGIVGTVTRVLADASVEVEFLVPLAVARTFPDVETLGDEDASDGDLFRVYADLYVSELDPA